MFKKVVFYVGIILAVLAASVVTALQLLPFAIALLLMGITIYGKKNLSLWIMVTAVIMLFINTFGDFSIVDIVYWLMVVIAFAL